MENPGGKTGHDVLRDVQAAESRARGRGRPVLEAWRQAGRASRASAGQRASPQGQRRAPRGSWGVMGAHMHLKKPGGWETGKRLLGSSRTGAGGRNPADAGTRRWAADPRGMLGGEPGAWLPRQRREKQGSKSIGRPTPDTTQAPAPTDPAPRATPSRTWPRAEVGVSWAGWAPPGWQQKANGSQGGELRSRGSCGVRVGPAP